ncbi:MAG TPA: hypothetical protein VF541_13970 [Longimicrobium sp.]|jgi:hypothetical protein
MADFIPGQPIETKEPTIEVTLTPQKPLAVGPHLFQLVVIDNSGNESVPVTVTVNVVDTDKPTAILDAPARVPAGQAFTLDGRRSTDLGGGQVVRWRWTMVS